MKRRALLRLLPLAALAAVAPRAALTAEQTPKPGAKDTCPVCGMLVSKYPQWTASVAFKDGHAHHFDGAKDLLKYLFDIPKYAAGHTRADVTAVEVTEYYGLTKIDARKAFYVRLGRPRPYGPRADPVRIDTSSSSTWLTATGHRLAMSPCASRSARLRTCWNCSR